MLKNFWNKKKHLIQLVGILTAIGALFLSIPLPENEKASFALLNIQAIWLLIISVSLLVLFINFWLLAEEFEEKTKIKHKFETNVLSTAILLIIIYLLINLYLYLFHVHKATLIKFISHFVAFFMLLILSLFYYLVNKTKSVFKNKYLKIILKITNIIIPIIIVALGLMLSTSLTETGFNFRIISLIDSFLGLLIVCTLILPIVVLLEKDLSKRMKEKISTIISIIIIFALIFLFAGLLVLHFSFG